MCSISSEPDTGVAEHVRLPTSISPNHGPSAATFSKSRTFDHIIWHFDDQLSSAHYAVASKSHRPIVFRIVNSPFAAHLVTEALRILFMLQECCHLSVSFKHVGKHAIPRVEDLR